MAKRIAQVTNITPTATSDSATALANDTYLGIETTGSATQRLDVLEVLITGLAGASAPTIMQLARNGAVASTTSSLIAPNSDGPSDTATAALAIPPRTFTRAVGGPQRSANFADARLQLGINAFGGILRWNAAPTQQWTITGTTAPGGSSSISAYSGGTVGAVSLHCLYEPYVALFCLGFSATLAAIYSAVGVVIA